MPTVTTLCLLTKGSGFKSWVVHSKYLCMGNYSAGGSPCLSQKKFQIRSIDLYESHKNSWLISNKKLLERLNRSVDQAENESNKTAIANPTGKDPYLFLFRIILPLTNSRHELQHHNSPSINFRVPRLPKIFYKWGVKQENLAQKNKSRNLWPQKPKPYIQPAECWQNRGSWNCSFSFKNREICICLSWIIPCRGIRIYEQYQWITEVVGAQPDFIIPYVMESDRAVEIPSREL